jgi:predicted ABC-type ATPase
LELSFPPSELRQTEDGQRCAPSVFDRPTLVLLASPNGAGTTTASVIFNGLGVRDFVNADAIAQQVRPDNPHAAKGAPDAVGKTCRVCRENRMNTWESCLMWKVWNGG